MISFLLREISNLISDKKFSEILTGSVWALSAMIFATGLGLVSTIIVARLYGPDILGIIALINSFLMLTDIFVLLGTSTSILRLIPEYLAKYSVTSAFRVFRKILHMIIGISLVLSVVLFWGADLIAEQLFSKPRLSFYFALAAVFIVFKSLMLFNTQAVRGLRLIRVFALMLTMPQACNLCLLLFLGPMLSTQNVPVYALLGGFAITGIFGCIVMNHAFKQKVHNTDVVQDMPLGQILSLSLPMLMSATMAFIIGQTGVVMLGLFRSETDVGYYSVAVKLAALSALILHAANSMAAPKISELYHANEIDDLFHVAKKSSKLIFWTTSPILLSLILLGNYLLYFLFGEDFTVAYLSMVYLAFGQFVSSITGITGIYMNMTGLQRAHQNIAISAAGINIVLNLLLTPSFGIIGAALSGMFSSAFWDISALLFIKIKHGKSIGYFPFFCR